MKIHELTVENLNSLYGRHTVDFDRSLEGASLFLIHGPTGSGKSTLMDAVSLALFGTTPRMSAERSDRTIAEQIMSRGAGECSAELVFSKLTRDGGGRQRYRVKWMARRARGQAQGKVQATERSLEIFDGTDWSVMVSDHREKEFGPHFAEVLEGFTPEDFQRSMLLAQGQFDAMLHARPQERASILERLTNTNRYREIGARAAQLDRAWRRRKERLEAELQAIGAVDPAELARALEAAQEASRRWDDAKAQVKALEEVERWRRGWIEKSRALKEAEARLAAANEAVAGLAEKRGKLTAFEEARGALAALDALNRARETEKRVAQDLAEQHKALPGTLEAFAAASAALEKAEGDYQHAKAVRDDLREPLQRAKEAAAALKQASTTLAAAEQQVAVTAREIDSATQAVAEARQRVDEAKAALEGLLADPHGVDEALRRRLRGGGLTTPAIEAERERHRTRAGEISRALEHRRALDRLRTDLQSARAEHDAHAKQATDLAEQLGHAAAAVQAAEKVEAESHHAFEALRLRQSLFEYRAALEPGAPCPLCGGEEHPWANETAPDDEVAFEQAKARHEGATADLLKARGRQGELRGARTHVEAAATKTAERTAALTERESRAAAEMTRICREAGLPPESHADALRRLAEECDGALEWLMRCAKSQASIESHTNIFKERSARLEAAADRARQAGAEEVRLRADRTKTHDACATTARELAVVWTAAARPDDPGQRPAADASDAAIDAYQRTRVEAAEQARDVSRHKVEIRRREKEVCEKEIARLTAAGAEARSQAETAQAGLRAAMAAQGIASEEALVGRRLPEEQAKLIRDETTAADAAVQQADGACRACRSNLDHHATEKPAHTEVDATDDQLKASLQAARGARDVVEQAFAEQNAELLRLRGAMDKAREAGERLDTARSEAAVWHRLHQLIGVRDGEQFKEFAQALNLRQLLSKANLQLAKLKDRYLLQQIWTGSGEDDDTARIPTLEFEIEDQLRPGSPRSIKTLSGGESFLVSLALALGLSDLRTSSMPVETLLLDEGFGTLDPETLDTALAALQQLQASGRQIGIISHVVGLKERIEARIEVRLVGDGRSEIRAGVSGEE